MGISSKQVKKRYNRFSLIYDLVETLPERFFFRKWRKKYVSKLNGKVLEIGVGTGKNLPYYNYKKANVTAIDLSDRMLEKAQEKATLHNYPVNLKLANAEKLPFKDNSFDYVITTFVLCSVPNQVKALKEMKRVCKKKGKIILLEHMLSENKLIALFENLHNPITSSLFGFNINRRTVENIKKCDLRIVNEKNLAFYDVFRKLEVQK